MDHSSANRRAADPAAATLSDDVHDQQQEPNSGVARLARAALWYAGSQGWLILPVKPGANHPPLLKGWQQEATANGDTIKRWWQRWPAANIGLHCAGLLVLDVDPRHDGPASLATLIAKHGRLTPTICSRRPGGGCHYIWRCSAPVRNHQAETGHLLLGAGLDVKTSGGVITLPPSIRPDGVYRWVPAFAPWRHAISDAPDWLVRILTPPPRAPVRAAIAFQAPSTPDRLTCFALDRDLAAVRLAAPGCQNATLFVAGRKLGRFCAEGLLDWSEVRAALLAVSAGHDDSEPIRAKTIDSALRSRGAA